jgi:heme/copper-type cytochrome/quinol oxidase subunit 3
MMGDGGNKFLYNNEKKFNLHPFHLVDPSPWPFFISVALFVLTLGIVLFFHTFKYGAFIMFLGLVFLISTMVIWWRDVIREATFRGQHTLKVTQGLRLGVVLFIVSEVMFFVSFFWAFFHSSLAPSVEIGGVWPPKGLAVLNPLGLPLLNTLILLSSGATVTYAHYCIQSQNLKHGFVAFGVTIFLAVAFTLFQAYEYVEAPFNLADGVYASTFFLATGFHGLHVIIGTIFLATCFYRFAKFHFTPRHHLGFEAAAWYWHFVDVVWLILFLFVYIWGSE